MIFKKKSFAPQFEGFPAILQVTGWFFPIWGSMVCICTWAGVFQLQQQGVIFPGKQNCFIKAWLWERPDWLCQAAQCGVSSSGYTWKFVLLIESLLMANTGWHFTWFSYVLWVIGTMQSQPQGKESPAVTDNRGAITAQFPLTGPEATATSLTNVWSSLSGEKVTISSGVVTHPGVKGNLRGKHT